MRERPVTPDPMLYSPHGDVWETLVAVVLGLALAASGLVWLAAQVAALCFGAHHPIHLGLSDMPEVLFQLAEHPGDPRMAFPAAARPGRAHSRGAGWATGWQLRALRLRRRAQPWRLVLGRRSRFGRLVAAEACHSVIAFGPPGSLKTTALVIPALLEWQGPAVATSIKPDVLRATITYRAAMGEVWVYDPLG